jgi:hypothetical protein
MKHLGFTLVLALMANLSTLNAGWQKAFELSATNTFTFTNSRPVYTFTLTNSLPVYTLQSGDSLWQGLHPNGMTNWTWINNSGNVSWTTQERLVQYPGDRMYIAGDDTLLVVRHFAHYSWGTNVPIIRLTREGTFLDTVWQGLGQVHQMTGYGEVDLSLGETHSLSSHGLWSVRNVYVLTNDGISDYQLVPDRIWERWLNVSDDFQVVLTVTAHSGQVGVSWFTKVGHRYQVQVTSDLQTWEDYGEPVYGDNGQAEVSVSGPGIRLVRVIVFE